MNRFRKVAATSLVVLLAGAVLVGCSDDSDDEETTTTTTTAASVSTNTTAAAATGTSVTITGFKFSPATLNVKAGAVISVTNQDSVAHTLTADDGSFDTGSISQGQTKTVIIPKTGTLAYHCTPHPNMKGTFQAT